MSVNTQEWNERYDKFESQVKEFNTKMRQSALSKEEVDEIYTVVKREVNRLSELSEAASKRQEELTQNKCCCFVPNRIAIWSLTGLNALAQTCAAGGAALAIFDDNPATKWTGVGVLGIGGAFAFITTICQTKLSLNSDEVSKLATLNKEGVEHAKIFKKFLKRLKEIKHLETRLLEDYQSREKSPLANHVVINLGSSSDLDGCISACIKGYEMLPNCYRHEDVYCHMISHLIQRLPPSDPLRIGLNALEPRELNEDISLPAEHSLPFHYLPTFQSKKLSSSQEKSEEDKWSAEAHPRISLVEDSERIEDSEQAKLKYEQQIAYYKNQVMQRFDLKHNISFFETPAGWKISSTDGIKRFVDHFENEDDYTETIDIEQTGNDKEQTKSADEKSIDDIV